MLKMRWFTLCGVVLMLAATVLSATPAQAATARHHALRATAKHHAAPMMGRTWYLWVGAESTDHAIQGAVFLPREIWINQGDAITWVSYTADIHTVTFLKPGQSRPMFNPSDPMQGRPYGGTNYDGQSYYNSGILSTMMGMRRSYTLRFGVTGTYYYICLVHRYMYGIVHVLPQGWQVPYTQADYNQQIAAAEQQILNTGAGLMDQAERNASQYYVWVGVGTTSVSVMRFINSTIYVRAGDVVTFVNYDPQMPHTVTFGPVSRNAATAYGDPMNYDGTKALNSGYLGIGQQYGTTFRVRFTRPGTYHYYCALHAMLGMYGTVVVSGSNYGYGGGSGY